MRSVQTLIKSAFEETPQKPFLIFPEIEKELSFAELYHDCRQYSAIFDSLKLKKGEKIGFLLENGIASAELFFAIIYGGYVAAPLNLIAQESQLAYILKHSEMRVLFYSAGFAAMVSRFREQFSDQIIFIEQDKNKKPFADRTPVVDDDGAHTVHAEDEALLMYTSGTTGMPKGVLLTNQNIIAGGINVNLAHRITADDCSLCVLPFYHINAQMVSLLSSLVAQNPLIIPNKFSVNEFWDLIDRYRCTWFSVVPTIIAYLIHKSQKLKETPFLRFGRSASASLPPELHRQFESQFGVSIVETMGLTETAAQILSNPIDEKKRKYGSVGLGYGNEVLVVNQDFEACPPNVEGEIIIKGDNVMKCYFKNEAETAKTIQDGWLKTGDLGKKDDDGFIFVTGRIKELIIKGGENIAPREIDEVLYSIEGVIEAAAFAVDDQNYGQNIEAALVFEKQALGMEEIAEHCLQKLGAFKTPQKIHILESLPKGPSGKIQRNKIKDLLS